MAMAEWMIDGILVACYVLLSLAVLAVLVTAGVSVAKRYGAVADVRGVAPVRIAVSIIVMLFVVLALTFFFGSSEAVTVNGREYVDTLWIRLSDMLIGTVAVLLLLAVMLICFGSLLIRK